MILSTFILICIPVLFLFYYKRNLFHSIRKRNSIQFQSFELEMSSHYFKQLNTEEKLDFIHRVGIFLNSKDFIARGIQLSDAIRLKIAAYATQITFGFDEISLVHFNTIVIYPSAYKSPFTGNFHIGETHPKGAIVFSLSDLERGHSISNDGLNLALHEFAHAVLIVNKTENSEFDFIHPTFLSKFDRIAEIEMQKIKEDSNHFLRAYAATNRHEFFAVCVENFFERPTEFRSIHPQLFEVMVHLLQQNPLLPTKRIRYISVL